MELPGAWKLCGVSTATPPTARRVRLALLAGLVVPFLLVASVALAQSVGAPGAEVGIPWGTGVTALAAQTPGLVVLLYVVRDCNATQRAICDSIGDRLGEISAQLGANACKARP